VLTRPSVGVDEEHGFLPGNLGDKFEPWAAPFVSVLKDLLGADVYQKAVNAGEIEVVPVGMLRGRSFDNALVLLDEAQNTTYRQMKMLLTRMGEGATVVVSGDLDQKDIEGESGLDVVASILTGASNDRIEFVKFGVDDIVRSEFCEWWVRQFNKHEGH
jgi:phosphate starvation-inducible PhoH-like protein